MHKKTPECNAMVTSGYPLRVIIIFFFLLPSSEFSPTLKYHLWDKKIISYVNFFKCFINLWQVDGWWMKGRKGDEDYSTCSNNTFLKYPIARRDSILYACSLPLRESKWKIKFYPKALFWSAYFSFWREKTKVKGKKAYHKAWLQIWMEISIS